MTSSIQPAINSTNNAAQTANAASTTTIPGTTSPLAAGSAQPTARSYASATATKNISSPSIASSTTPSVAVGGPKTQHAKANSVSPVNGKPPIQPAVPVVNSGANGASDHSRQKSSVSFQNGGPVGSSNRNSIQFGSTAAGGSPAIANSVPYQPHHSNLPAPNPRITSPATSPSPIPQPASTSGGRPPSSLQGQGNGLVFGSLGEGGDQNARPSMPPNANVVPQAQHLRRESSQSAHSDMSNAGMNRTFQPNGGRGRGFPPGGYPQVAHSPVTNFRAPNQNRGGPNMPQQFQGPHPNSSPYRQARSPAITPAAVQQQMQYANNPQMHAPYAGYPQQFQPQQGFYNMPNQLDPTYGYYHNPYAIPQGVAYQPAPPSPRPPAFTPTMAAQAPYIHGQYANGPHAPGMSRSSSQVSERPPSTIPAPQTPSLPAATHISHTPSQSTSSPAAASAFTIPSKSKSKGIVIKNADGEVVTFDKKAASPAPTAQSRSPVVVASTPTPPPRASSAAGSQHGRTQSVKTDAEKKHDFQEQFRKQVEAQKLKDEEEARAAKAKEEAEAKAAKEKEEAEAKAAKEKEEAEAKAAKEKEAEAQAAKEKEEAEKAAKAKEEDEAKAAKERAEEEERLIAEMEAAEREEEERERQYQEKKKKENEEKARIAAAKEAEELKKAERAAEEAEEARAKNKGVEEETPEAKAEREKLFASLKRPTFGPGASGTTSTPTSDSSMPPPAQPSQSKAAGAAKPKPAPIKTELGKSVEPAQPTPGMQALKSARFLQVREDLKYPEGIRSPNPALNQGAKGKGQRYDKSFLLQFQDVFKEKPSIDWDNKVKETVGDSSDSARPQSARGASGMGSRSASRGGSMGMSGPMGNFNQTRTLPPGTTSEQRFRASQTMTNPLAQFANRPGSFPVGGGAPISRTGSFPSMGQIGGPNSPRTAGGSRKGSKRNPMDKNPSRHGNEEQLAKTMPLTAGMELKPLEVSKSGWKPASIVGGGAPAQLPNGHLPPDMVQRKVKAALNKMAPEKFDKIADQILEIAAQSKDESDGRTLRQVIQLTFEKACDEAHWAPMYAKFCKRMLETMSPEIKDENVRDKNGNPVVGGALFRKYLLNRCQEEFERGWEVNLPEKPDGSTEEAAMLSDEYYIAAAAKRRGLGLIQFIGELYKLGMLTLRIMHECVMKLLNFEGSPDETAIESLVKLLKAVGATMDSTDQGPKMIAAYFERIQNIMNMPELPSRMRFMLMDLVDLRKANWKSKDDAKGPKTLQEIHAEAAAAQQAQEMERQRSNARGGGRPPIGRGDVRSFSGGGMPPPDYQKNQLGMEDLRRLSTRASGRNASQSPGTFGPSSNFGTRSSSGRGRLGPSGLGERGDSHNSSRTGTPPVKESGTPAHQQNAFSALAALDASGDHGDDVASPPSAKSSPVLTKSQPAAASKEGEAAKPSEP